MRSPALVALLAVLLTTMGACRAATRAGGGPAADPPVELPALAGRSWTLAAWGKGDPAPATPAVTLRYAAGSLQGRSGCNRYTAPVEQRPGRGAIAVGAIAATRMMCPAPADAIERRFLTALAGAKALELRDGRLGVVTTDADGRSTMLVFTPAAAP